MNNETSNGRTIDPETRAVVEQTWQRRGGNFFPTRTSKAYKEARSHFFSGAMAALGVVDSAWTIGIMSDRGELLGDKK